MRYYFQDLGVDLELAEQLSHGLIRTCRIEASLYQSMGNGPLSVVLSPEFLKDQY